MKKFTITLRSKNDDDTMPVTTMAYELPYPSTDELEKAIVNAYGTNAYVVRMSEPLSPFDYEDMEEVYTLNEVLLFIETKRMLHEKSDDDAKLMWDTFVALQECTGYGLLETFEVYALGENFELFHYADDMTDVAKELVAQDRVFSKPVPHEVQVYLDYVKIADALALTGEFFITSKGIMHLYKTPTA